MILPNTAWCNQHYLDIARHCSHFQSTVCRMSTCNYADNPPLPHSKLSKLSDVKWFDVCRWQPGFDHAAPDPPVPPPSPPAPVPRTPSPVPPPAPAGSDACTVRITRHQMKYTHIGNVDDVILLASRNREVRQTGHRQHESLNPLLPHFWTNWVLQTRTSSRIQSSTSLSYNGTICRISTH